MYKKREKLVFFGNFERDFRHVLEVVSYVQIHIRISLSKKNIIKKESTNCIAKVWQQFYKSFKNLNLRFEKIVYYNKNLHSGDKINYGKRFYIHDYPF